MAMGTHGNLGEWQLKCGDLVIRSTQWSHLIIQINDMEGSQFGPASLGRKRSHLHRD